MLACSPKFAVPPYSEYKKKKGSKNHNLRDHLTDFERIRERKRGRSYYIG
jgi:hypothetical protein